MVTTTVEIAGRVRLTPPGFSTEPLAVAAPPPVPDHTPGSSRFVAVIVLGAVLGAGALIWGARSGISATPMALVLPGMTVASTLALMVQSGRRRGFARLDDQRRRYLDHLERLSLQMRDAAERQHVSLTWTHPAPRALWTLVGGTRMWERRFGDSDFGHVRIGLGSQALCRRIVLPPIAPLDDLDPVTADALRRCVRAHAVVDDLPIAVALPDVAVVAVDGRPADVRALVRAMICQLAVSHGPSEVLIAAVVGPGVREHWDWLKWLPHSVHPSIGGPMVYDSAAEAEALLTESGRPHVVLVVDRPDREHPVGREAMTAVVIGGPRDNEALRLHLEGDRLSLCDEEFARADAMNLSEARACARRLARYRGARPVHDVMRQWYAELGLDSGEVWRPHSRRDELRVPLGLAPDGAMVGLDVKEAARGGQGPHGLCIGATGSGKSELLRTVVLGMVCRHSPDELNLVLIDFKGGATFLGLEGLGHVAAIITNLSEEEHLVARAKEALAGEIHRRQQMLRRAGNASNLDAYRRSRLHDQDLPPLPSLFVVVDEFAELLHQHPDFTDLFAMIGRVGRSLGVHLLLASQRLDEGRLRGVESHLSYRICLRTSTAAESRAVLGVGDAAELPTTPGAAYLRGADARLTRFQTTYLGVAAPGAALDHLDSDPVVRQFTSIPVVPPSEAPRHRTVLDTLIERLTGRGSRARQIWLPPLPTSPRLADLPDAGCRELSAQIGVVDRPFEQRRVPLVVDTGGAGGNVAVVGAPQSGKSQTVRTLVTALAARHHQRRIQFYCLDFGGGTLETLCVLPHVGSVANRRDHELVRGIVSHVEAIMRTRESGCADEFGDVFLVVDGWQTLRDEFGELESTITALAAQGLSFGVHLIATAGRWADLRPGLKDQIGTRIELRLGDPLDSEMDRKQAALVPLAGPGRGVTRDGHHFAIATSTTTEVTWRGAWRAPRVRLLPGTVDHAAVLEQAGHGPGVLIGIGGPELTPTAVDFRRHAHLLIVGDRECGKTAALRTLCLEIIRGATEQAAQLYLVDFRRTLLGAVDPRHLHGYAFSPAGLAEQLPALLDLLRNRLPAPDLTAEQLQMRSWWSGPEVFVIVDDHDFVSATAVDALAGLVEMLPHATDIGLHLIVARRCAGIARAMYDPLLAHLRDSGCMALLMSGSPEEGAVVGTHRAAPQPSGRGLFVTRDAAQRIQVGWCPP